MVKGKFYSEMEREELINYCELHCQTQRALFHKSMVAQMIEYAGCPEKYLSPEEVIQGNKEWYSLHEPMEGLVKLAIENKNL